MTPAEALIAEQAPPLPAPRAATKDDKAIEAVGQQLGARGRQAGEHLSKVSPLTGTMLAVKAEDGAAALSRVVGKFFPGLLKAGGSGMILFDVVTVITSLAAMGVAAMVDAGRLPADHPAAQRMGVTELAAQLIAKQALHSQQLAQAAAGVPQQMDAAQFAYFQNQALYQQQMQQQQQAAQQQHAAAQYAQWQAQQRAQAQAYNASAGLYPQFGG